MKSKTLAACMALAAMALTGCGLFDSLFMKELETSITAPTVTKSGTYKIDSYLTISSTWTVEAGTKFVMGPGAYISIDTQGSIKAAGTADKPITFTSSKATPAKGDWLGIDDAGNGSTYAYCVVEYAETGLEITGSLSSVIGSTFRGNGLGLDLDLAKGMATFSSNTFASNDDPLSINASFDLDDTNGFSDNLRPYVLFSGDTISAARTWAVSKAPIRVPYMHVDATLTLRPGVTLAFDASGYLGVRSGGTLKASGTAAARIAFTSSRPVKAKDDWVGISIDGNGSQFDYCDVEYAYAGIELESTCGSLALTNSRIRQNTIGVDNWSSSVTIAAGGTNAFSDNGTDIATH